MLISYLYLFFFFSYHTTPKKRNLRVSHSSIYYPTNNGRTREGAQPGHPPVIAMVPVCVLNLGSPEVLSLGKV